MLLRELPSMLDLDSIRATGLAMSALPGLLSCSGGLGECVRRCEVGALELAAVSCRGAVDVSSVGVPGNLYWFCNVADGCRDVEEKLGVFDAVDWPDGCRPECSGGTNSLSPSSMVGVEGPRTGR